MLNYIALSCGDPFGSEMSPMCLCEKLRCRNKNTNEGLLMIWDWGWLV